MFIIGHRGAAGLAPENTLKAIEVAKKNNVDAIECDVRLTKDDHLVLCHDEGLLRITGSSKLVKDLTLEEIRAIKTESKQPIPTLKEALKTAGDTPLIIEGKGPNWAQPLLKLLKEHKGPKPKVISYNHPELLLIATKLKSIETYAVEDNRAFEVITLAKRLGFDGVSLAFSLYNPLTYLHAKRVGLKLITSPINRAFTVRVFHFLYPKAQITTDYPNKFKNRHKKSKTNKK